LLHRTCIGFLEGFDLGRQVDQDSSGYG